MHCLKKQRACLLIRVLWKMVLLDIFLGSLTEDLSLAKSQAVKETGRGVSEPDSLNKEDSIKIYLD